MGRGVKGGGTPPHWWHQGILHVDLESFNLGFVITSVSEKFVTGDGCCAKERAVEFRENPLVHIGIRVLGQHFFILLE